MMKIKSVIVMLVLIVVIGAVAVVNVAVVDNSADKKTSELFTGAKADAFAKPHVEEIEPLSEPEVITDAMEYAVEKIQEVE